MFYVYAIQSLSRNYTYVGLTNNLERRILQHNKVENRTTKAYTPFALIHSEGFGTRIEARTKEKYLKSGIGKEFIKTLPRWRTCLPAGRIGRRTFKTEISCSMFMPYKVYQEIIRMWD